MSWSSQMSNEPRAFSAALYSFQLVVRYFGLAGAFILSVYPSLESGAAGGDLCNRAHDHAQQVRQHIEMHLLIGVNWLICR
jgi:hypothetical protein